MSEAIWFYVDVSGRQVGPVTADEVRAALRNGSTKRSSLAWCEGMAGWQPITELEGALDLPPAPADPTSQPPSPAVSVPPAQPAPSARPDSIPIAQDIVYAGFWRRLAAHVLDHVILFVPLFVLLVAVFAFIGASQSESDATRIGFAFFPYLAYFLIAPFYFAGQESSASQATLGKRALGIKVTDLDGRRISFGNAMARWFASALSYCVLYVGFIMAGFTERKRALHDLMVSTQVVDEWAYTQFPERQQRGMSGCLIAFLVLLVGGLFVVPILAAISISQYQDYVVRAQVTEGSALAQGAKLAVAEYVRGNNALPQSNVDAGLPQPNQITGAYVSYVDIGRHPGRIEVGFSTNPPQHANVALEGKHLLFDATIESGGIQWSCHSEDLKQKFCPSTCNCNG